MVEREISDFNTSVRFYDGLRFGKFSGCLAIQRTKGHCFKFNLIRNRLTMNKKKLKQQQQQQQQQQLK